MGHFKLNMLYQRTPRSKPLCCSEHFDVPRYCTILYDIAWCQFLGTTYMLTATLSKHEYLIPQTIPLKYL